jgi:hypothetical protein
VRRTANLRNGTLVIACLDAERQTLRATYYWTSDEERLTRIRARCLEHGGPAWIDPRHAQARERRAS